jgi:hypothetical protein
MRKSAQVNYPRMFTIRIVPVATIDFSLIQAQLPIKSKRAALYRVLYDGSHIKWAWLRWLAVRDHSFELKRDIRVTIGLSAISAAFSRAATHGRIFK